MVCSNGLSTCSSVCWLQPMPRPSHGASYFTVGGPTRVLHRFRCYRMPQAIPSEMTKVLVVGYGEEESDWMIFFDRFARAHESDPFFTFR